MHLFKKKQKYIPGRRLATADESLDIVGASNSFRRNQTLANSQLAQSPRSQAHHLTIHRRKVLLVFGVVLLSVIFLWLLISNFTARVSVSVFNSNMSKTLDRANYEKVIQDFLDTNPMSRFTFFLDKVALNAFVSSKLPEVNMVSQQGMLQIGQTGFALTMRRPVAGWVINNKQYYVDAIGESFDINYFDNPSVQIIDNSGAANQSDTVVASRRFLGFVGKVVSESAGAGYTVTKAVLPPNTTRQLELSIKEGDYTVKLSIDRAAGEQIEDMVQALRYFNSKGYKPAFIDVRVSGKAFYK
ncbi:MAG: hypothetical protein WCP11_02720 [Candidatus Saccharibacteria bacterium]